MATIKNTEFQALPYAYNALEPYIDALTVEIHYSRHHKAYFDNVQNAVKGTEMENLDFISLFKNISKYPVAVRNNGGGYINHVLYWENMKANGGGTPSELWLKLSTKLLVRSKLSKLSSAMQENPFW